MTPAVDGPAENPAAADVVAAVWCEVFEVERVEPDDDFFAMGGHSVLAVAMVARLRAELGLRVPVRLVMDNPTVAGLAGVLAADLADRR